MDLFQAQNNITLQKVEIENYRGIESESFSVGESGVVFAGENGVGKTTRIEAILWCLADSLFDGSTNGLNSYLKPNESPNDTVTKVQLTFNDGGLQTVLTKEFREKWVKSRGTNDIVFDGTETKYYFNGSEMIKKDYLRKLYEIFGMKKAVAKIDDETKLLSKVNLMNLFLNLEHFKTLDTKTLRELVILVVGDEDITNYDMSEGLKTILKSQRFDLDTSKKQLKDNIKAYQKNIDAKRGEIEAYNKMLDKQVAEPEALKNELKVVQEDIANLKVKVNQNEAELTQDLSYQILQKEIELEKLKGNNTKEETEEDKKFAKIKQELEDTREEYNTQRELFNQIKLEVEALSQAIENREYEIGVLKQQGKDLVAKVKELKHNKEITCPHCNQPFTYEHHKEEIEKLSQEARMLKEKLSQKENDLGDLKKEQIDKIANMNILEPKLQDIVDKGVELKNELEIQSQNTSKSDLYHAQDVFTSEPILTIMEDIKRLKSSKNDISLSLLVERKKIETQIVNLETKEKELFEQLSFAETATTVRKSLQSATIELKSLQEKLTHTEQLDIELKELIGKYLKNLEQKALNGFGENIRFKLFEVALTTDSIKPICEMYVKDTGNRWVQLVNGVNTGHSVPRTIEFISTVKTALEIKPSLMLIDFFESVGQDALMQSLRFGEQLIATEVRRGQKEMTRENL